MSAIPLLTPKTAARMAEIDRVLDIAAGDGIAEVMLENILDDIKGGEVGLIMEGWDWDDPELRRKQLLELAAKWVREDRQEAKSKSRKGGAAA